MISVLVHQEGRATIRFAELKAATSAVETPTRLVMAGSNPVMLEAVRNKCAPSVRVAHFWLTIALAVLLRQDCFGA